MREIYVVAPRKLRDQILTAPDKSHTGMAKTKSFARPYECWWRCIDANIKTLI